MKPTERTFAIIKPHCVRDKNHGSVIGRAMAEGFEVETAVLSQPGKVWLSHFYAEHTEKDFFDSMIARMNSGPAVFMILSRTDAVDRWRSLIGATDPREAEQDTLRRQFGSDLSTNVVHGSDSLQSAEREIDLFEDSAAIFARLRLP